MVSKVVFSKKSDNWATPFDFYKKLDDEFFFDIDVCASRENHKCLVYYDIAENGLSKNWIGSIFCNPPYSQIKLWLKKGQEEIINGNANVIVYLIPARTDTKYFHEYCLGKNCEIRFIKGRLKFGDSKNSAPFPSILVIMRSFV